MYCSQNVIPNIRLLTKNDGLAEQENELNYVITLINR